MQKASALCRVRHKTHIERIGGRETLLHPDMRSKNFITHLAPTSGILLSAGASSSHRSVVHSRRRSAQRCFQVLDLRHSHIFPSFFSGCIDFCFFSSSVFVTFVCAFSLLLHGSPLQPGPVGQGSPECSQAMRYPMALVISFLSGR